MFHANYIIVGVGTAGIENEGYIGTLLFMQIYDRFFRCILKKF
jgi:hypothetical protein